MKLDASFAPRLRILGPAVVLTLMAVSLAMLVASVAMITNAAQLRGQRAGLERQLAALAAREPVTDPNRPSHRQIEQLRGRVSAFNRLSNYAGSPLPSLLARLEPLLPDHAYLVTLHQRPQTGEVDMTIEAASPDPLTLFLTRLQQDPHFVDVLLTKQAHPSGNGPRRVQFQIRMREREA